MDLKPTSMLSNKRYEGSNPRRLGETRMYEARFACYDRQNG